MKAIALMFVSLMLLTACNSAPAERYLAADAVEVESTELENYWVAEPFDFQFNPSGSRPSDWTGTATIRYLIDSNGQTFDAEIIESSGDSGLEAFAYEFVSQTHYRPATANPQRTPVYTSAEVTFDLERVN